jgi:hypothetical protein
MKKLTKLFASVILIFMTYNSNAQFAFTVNPGLNYNGATFGFKAGNFVPYLGIAYMGGRGTYTSEGTQWNNTTLQMESYKNENVYSGQLIVPTLGAKYYFINSGDLKAYGNLNVTKPILTVTSKYNGTVDQNVEDYVKNISVWAGELGFGAEYYFASQFSIGGEFGLRAIRARYKNEHDDQVYNPLTGLNETFAHTLLSKGLIAPTYARVSLNFFFGKGWKKKNKSKE